MFGQHGILAEIESIILLFDGMESRKKLINRLNGKINNIMYNDQLQIFITDQLQHFIAECYNSFGEIVAYDNEYIQRKSGSVKVRRCQYSNFKILDHKIQN